MTFRSDLESVGLSIAKEAMKDKTPLPERIDALKALTTLYATLKKDKGNEESEPSGSTMADFQQAIEETRRGVTEVHSGRGTRRSDA